VNRWEAARPARDYAVHLAVWQQATRMLAWADGPPAERLRAVV
jgi:hypothetical protein